MKASHFFYIGLAIDALILVLCLSNFLFMESTMKGMEASPMNGYGPVGKMMLWALPASLLLLMGAAFLLKIAGRILPANILLWIPALPMLVGILLWGGLAVLFILGGK